MNDDTNSYYTLLPHSTSNDVNYCDLWCFHNSSLGIFREHGVNTWFRCLDCCSTCLELQCNNSFSHFLIDLCKNKSKEHIDDDCIILCCCISYTLL